jgi:hypothetical protein
MVWTEYEGNKLKDSVQMHGGKGWVAIAALIITDGAVSWITVSTGTTARSGKWTEHEDGKLKDSIEMYGSKDWRMIAALVPGRATTQCRHGFNNALNQSKKSVFKLMMS